MVSLVSRFEDGASGAPREFRPPYELLVRESAIRS
jgi:hypothetical protein